MPAGMVLAMLPGVAKEVSDMDGSGTPSVKDMVANFAGVLVGAALPKQYVIAPIAPRGVVEGVSFYYLMEL
jgi:VanZ family protein